MTFWQNYKPYYPLNCDQLRPIRWLSKRPPIAPILFLVWYMNQNILGILIFGHFFSHIQCLGAVCGFWLFFYSGKGPYLGVFPILQYKRPQGEKGFFLEISNLGWFGFVKAQFWWHSILQRHRLPGSGLNSKGEEEKNRELVRF